MVRNFLSGLALGGVVAGVGLGVASQMVPLDPSKVAEIMVAGDSLPAVTADEPPLNDKAEVAQPESLDKAEKAVGNATAADTPSVVVEPEKSDALLAPLPEAVAPETAAIAPEPEAADTEAVPKDAVAADAGVSVVDATAKPEEGAADAAPDAVAPEAKVTGETIPDTKIPDAVAPDVVADAPAVATVPGSVPEAAPETDTATDAPRAAAPVEPTPAAEAPTLPVASPLEPAGNLVDQAVAGVTTGRLPRIGAAPAPDLAAETPVPGGVDAAQPPVVRFAQAFQNPGAKPLFAVLLMDPGTGDVNRAELAALPFSVTFVVDPMAPNAAEAAKIYRDAGQEVVMLANGIPKGANASDLEQSFAELTETLPEAVALIDTADATFQDNRGLAGEVVTLLAAQGRGVVTFDRGLNAADQVARREGVPSATIFRSLDDDGEDAPLIRRYLDRAAFKAAQEGQVVVIGTARPETIAALMEWAVEGRAASVALAPITAVMATK